MTLVGAGLLVLVPAVAAQAYVLVAYAPRGLVMTERPATSLGEVRTTLVLAGLKAGEARLLQAESRTYAGTPDRNALGQKITCERSDGTIVKESWTGTNIIAANGLTPLAQRLLFVAPSAGSYLCRLRIYVNSHYAQPARAVLYSGFVGDVQGTITDERIGIAREQPGQAVYFPGTETIVQRVLPINRYVPPTDSTEVRVLSDVYLTNCYGSGGAGCPRGTFPPAGSSTYAIQGFLIPSNRDCPAVATTRWVRTFDHLTHHIGQTVDLVAALPEGKACGSWRSHIEVQRISGLPFVVQLYPYSQATIIGT